MQTRPSKWLKVMAGTALLLVFAAPAFAGTAPPPAVPEMDAGVMTSALTLLAGGVLLITGRRAKK